MKTQNKLLLLITLTLSFAIANTVSANFFQDFETPNTNGWDVFGGNFNATRVASGTHDIQSHTGNYHAEALGPLTICDPLLGGSAATDWGGYSRPFPVGGWTTDIWVYLDMAATTVNDTRFDWIASAVNRPDCEHRRDFAFNFGWYNDSGPYGSGARFVVSGNTNTGRCHSDPRNPDMDPYTITTTGWYKLEGKFENNAGTLMVTLRVFDSTNPTTALHTWVISDATDTIGTWVGGNRYGWFSSQEFPFLAFDDTSLTGVQFYCDSGSGPAGSAGYWMTHPDAWCIGSIEIGTKTYTMEQAVTLMRTPNSRDMTYQMFAQLVATLLNVNCNYSDRSCVTDAINAAQTFMAGHEVGSMCRANDKAWKAVTWAYNTLVNYNTGQLCAPPVP